MKRIFLTFLIGIAQGAYCFAEPEMGLSLEEPNNGSIIESAGTWGIRFEGKDFLDRNAKSGEFSLKGSLIALKDQDQMLAKEFPAFTSAAWVKMGPGFKSGALFLRLVGADSESGEGRMKALVRADGPDHFCITFTAHAAGAKDEKTFTSSRIELPSSPTWVHIALVFSQQEIAFYSDGDLISTAHTDFDAVPALQGVPVFYVGGSGSTYDNWLFFDRALEHEELQQWMNKDQ